MNRNVLRQHGERSQSHCALNALLLLAIRLLCVRYTPTKIPQIVSGEELGRGGDSIKLPPLPKISRSDKEPPHASAYMHKLVTGFVAGTSFGFLGAIIQDNEVLMGIFSQAAHQTKLCHYYGYYISNLNSPTRKRRDSDENRLDPGDYDRDSSGFNIKLRTL